MKRTIVLLALFFLLTSCISYDSSPFKISTSNNSISLKELKEKVTIENYPKIDGSTSTLDLVRNIYNDILATDSGLSNEASKNFPKKASKTVPSYYSLIKGEVDMIFVPSPSKEILETAKSKNVNLEFYKVASEALIFVTVKYNPTENITKEQVKQIYIANRINNWKDLGGPDVKLIPISRNYDSGSYTLLDNFILEQEPVHPTIEKNYKAMDMNSILDQVYYFSEFEKIDDQSEKFKFYSYGLGFTVYNYLYNYQNGQDPESYNILSYEGVKPTRETITSGEYKLSDGYYAVIRGDSPKGSPERLIIDWLQSDEGIKRLSEYNGIMPSR